MASSVIVLFLAVLGTLAREKDSPKAAETRKKLQEKISVDYQDEAIRNVVDDLKSKVKGLGIKLDTAGGVSGNIKITYKADAETLEKVFAGMFKKNGLGYIVISQVGAYDGTVLIKQGKERGYPAGQEPDKTAAKDTDEPEKDKSKAKSKDKTKSNAKKKEEDKAAAKDKPEDDAEKAEHIAASKLKFAKTLAEDGKTAKAKERLEDIITKYPKTKAAEQARELLKSLDK